MPKHEGESQKEESRLIDFSDLTNEELNKRIEEQEVIDEEMEEKETMPVGKILYSLITEKLKRMAEEEK